MSFHPFRAKVREIHSQEIVVSGLDGQEWRLPLTAFEIPPVIGDTVAVLGVPLGGETAGQSRFAATILNELLSE